jgi:heme/copper-type cytochrome/quinol oxidase subunit 3
MPEGPEVETERLRETIEKELEHDRQGSALLKHIALTTAILAAVAAVASVLTIRLLLHISGYPSLTVGGLHIAHVTAGGIAMLIAMVTDQGHAHEHRRKQEENISLDNPKEHFKEIQPRRDNYWK